MACGPSSPGQVRAPFQDEAPRLPLGVGAQTFPLETLSGLPRACSHRHPLVTPVTAGLRGGGHPPLPAASSVASVQPQASLTIEESPEQG